MSVFALPEPPNPTDIAPGVGAVLPGGVERVLDPTGIAVLLVIAVAIDWFSIGPAWLQTRLLFMCIVTVARQGFDDSQLDDWTVDLVASLIRHGLDQTGGAFIAGASAQFLVGVLVGLLVLYALGAMAPAKASKAMGRLATIQFKETPIKKFNIPIWAVAIPLGLMADLPAGLVGGIAEFGADTCAFFTTPLPSIIFGAKG